MLAKKPDAFDGPLAALQALRPNCEANDLVIVDIALRDYVTSAKSLVAVAKLLGEFSRHAGWVVIHDLTLRIGEYHARVDHLLINRNFDVFLLDSSIGSSLIKVDSKGQFSRQCPGTTRVVPQESPLDLLTRRMQIMRSILPRVLAAVRPESAQSGLKPNVMGYFLLSPGVSVVRPGGFGSVDTRAFIPMDHIIKELNHYGASSGSMTAASLAAMNQFDAKTLQAFGERLAAMHRPDPTPSLEMLRRRYPPPPKVETEEEIAQKRAQQYSCHNCGDDTFKIRPMRMGGDALACGKCDAAYMLMQLFRCKNRPCSAKIEPSDEAGKIVVKCERCQKQKILNAAG